jgi:hypothetical protein
LPLYVTWWFSLAAFNIISLSFILNVLVIIQHEEVLFWSCLFGVLKTCCTWKFSLWKFPDIILLNIFSMPSSYTSSPFSMSLVYRLVLLMVSQSLACSIHTLYFTFPLSFSEYSSSSFCL